LSQDFIAVQAFSLGRDLLLEAGKDRLQTFLTEAVPESLR
jgi:hypothetical protein